MKKRILCAVFALIFVIGCASGLVSCGETSTLDYADMDLSDYITLGQYTGLTVDAAKVDEITPEKLEEEITKLLVANATGKLITERDGAPATVKADDTIKFSYAVKTTDADGNPKLETAKTEDLYDISEEGTSTTATVHINKKEFGDQLIGATLDKPFDVTITEKSGEETVTTVYEVTVLAIYEYHKTKDLGEDGEYTDAVLGENSIVSITFKKTVGEEVVEERTENRVNFKNVGKFEHDWYKTDFINALIKKKVGETVTIEIADAKFEVTINYIYEPELEPAKGSVVIVGTALGFVAGKKETSETQEAYDARVIKERLEYISKKMKCETTLAKGEEETDEAFDARVFELYTAHLDKTLKEDREEQLLVNKINAVWKAAVANTTVKKYSEKNLENYVKETLDNLNTLYQQNEQYYQMYEQYGITGYYKHYETLGDYIAANTDYSKENYKAEIEKKAEEIATEAMTLYAIADELGITVTDEIFKARIAEYAEDAEYEDTTADDGTVTSAADAFLADAIKSGYTEEQIRAAILWEQVALKLTESATVNFK